MFSCLSCVLKLCILSQEYDVWLFCQPLRNDFMYLHGRVTPNFSRDLRYLCRHLPSSILLSFNYSACRNFKSSTVICCSHSLFNFGMYRTMVAAMVAATLQQQLQQQLRWLSAVVLHVVIIDIMNINVYDDCCDDYKLLMRGCVM